jgi:hypothetical protein
MGIVKLSTLLAAAALFSIATSAEAAASYSTSVKYLDESGGVVGQQIGYCSNATFHGGNIHTAYSY